MGRLLILFLALSFTTSRASSNPAKAILPSEDVLPILFEQNKGQADSLFKFIARARGYTVFFAEQEVVIQLDSQGTAEANRPPTPLSTRGREWGRKLTMRMAGASGPPVTISGVGPHPAKVNYFHGKNRHLQIPLFRRLHYRSVYPGIDLVFYENHGNLEFDFLVSPGCDPSIISLEFLGQTSLEIQDNRLSISSPQGHLSFLKPKVYQETHDGLAQVATAYRVTALNRVVFSISSYDTGAPLIIDPEIVYSSYWGGSGRDLIFGVTLDQTDNIYIVGLSNSTDLPLPQSNTPFQDKASDDNDFFIAKFDSSFDLVYLTYLGGSGREEAFSYNPFVDPQGNLYLTGTTSSEDFPTTEGAYQVNYQGATDGFVVKLDPTGSELVYSTFLGSPGYDSCYGLDVDLSGNAYVVGSAYDPTFPTTPGAYQRQVNGSNDAFVSKLDPSGRELVYSTFVGGSGFDFAGSVAVNELGQAYVTGGTSEGSFNSTSFPTTANAFQRFFAGEQDSIVFKLNSGGDGLLFSSYLGGTGQEGSSAIRLDPAGDAYIVGITNSEDFPTTPNCLFKEKETGEVGYISKVSSDGSKLVYSTYFPEITSPPTIDASGSVYVAGATANPSFPLVHEIQSCGPGDAFISRLGPDGDELLFSTCFGGSGGEAGSLALDSSGYIYLVGSTSSADLPLLNPGQSEFQGDFDGFLTKLSPSLLETHFAQIGNGGGFTSDLLLNNLSSLSSVSGMVRFQGDDGYPISVGLAQSQDQTGFAPEGEVSEVDFTIPALGMLRISTDGKGDIATGSVIVESTHQIGGVVRFSIPGIGIAGVGQSNPLSSFIAPVRRQRGEINTGIAIVNRENTPVDLQLTLRSADGHEVLNGKSMIEDFPARGHLARFIDELFQSASTDKFEGSLTIEVIGGKVAATVLELGSRAGEFTTLPVSPVD